MSDCTIVVPCFNEARRLDLSAFLDHVLRHDDAFLFVNDGSTDQTGRLLDELGDVCPSSFRVLHLPQNRGKAEAVRQGMLAAFERPARYVGYWDADLATPLAAIAEFRGHLDQQPRVEALLGARVRLLGRQIERRTVRHCLGRLFATAAAGVLKIPVYDTQCGAKLFRATQRVRGIFAQPFRTTWIFDVELLARILATIPADHDPTELINELPLTAWRDVAGSKVKARDFVRAAGQLATIWQTYRLPQRTSQRPQIAASSTLATPPSRAPQPPKKLEFAARAEKSR